jgi:hypothetical protein
MPTLYAMAGGLVSSPPVGTGQPFSEGGDDSSFGAGEPPGAGKEDEEATTTDATAARGCADETCAVCAGTGISQKNL